MLLGQYDYRQRGSCGRDCRKATTRRARRAGASESNYSCRRNPSPSLTRSLPLVSPFQGCPLKAKAVSTAVSRLLVVSVSGFTAPRNDQYEISVLLGIVKRVFLITFHEYYFHFTHVLGSSVTALD
ncbi:MAG: hypothetical protein DVB29_05545 [Verrucomicrobia bacterium]|nr:MAG: hypothetical protein DVB29_05545 [Verrucomicrobiota bacterium]